MILLQFFRTHESRWHCNNKNYLHWTKPTAFDGSTRELVSVEESTPWWLQHRQQCCALGSYLVRHGGGRGVVAGRRVCVLVAHRRGRHLVVALRTGAGLVGALGRRCGVGRVLLCVVPAQGNTRTSEHLAFSVVCFLFIFIIIQLWPSVSLHLARGANTLSGIIL